MILRQHSQLQLRQDHSFTAMTMLTSAVPSSSSSSSCSITIAPTAAASADDPLTCQPSSPLCPSLSSACSTADHIKSIICVKQSRLYTCLTIFTLLVVMALLWFTHHMATIHGYHITSLICGHASALSSDGQCSCVNGYSAVRISSAAIICIPH